MGDRRAAERALRALLQGTARLPRGLRRALAGAPPLSDRGVPLDEALHWMLFLQGLTRRGLRREAVAAAREAMLSSVRITEAGHVEVGAVEALELGGRPARIFRPVRPRPPALLALHGGGWTTGDLRSHEAPWRILCASLGWAVVALHYRLAPEHPFPAALDDTLAAWRALRAQAEGLGLDPGGLFMGGDSAGGNLTAAACLALRDGGEPPPAGQVLVYPATDLRRQTASHRRFARGFLLSEDDLDWHLAHYAAPDPLDPRASPLLAGDLRGLPPAVVATAGFDPLRDEGEAYARALEAAGVPVRALDAADQVHGFMNLSGVSPGSARALDGLIEGMAWLERTARAAP